VFSVVGDVPCPVCGSADVDVTAYDAAFPGGDIPRTPAMSLMVDPVAMAALASNAPPLALIGSGDVPL
jgi:hypothetical protein